MFLATRALSTAASVVVPFSIVSICVNLAAAMDRTYVRAYESLMMDMVTPERP